MRFPNRTGHNQKQQTFLREIVNQNWYNMMIVQELTEQTLCETIDNLLAEEEFESVFSKNEESTIISPKDGDKLFKRFNESL